MSKSEFGRGYTTCLRMFVNHRKRLDRYMGIGTYVKDDLAPMLWANGSSDHLYELKRPRKDITRDEWQTAKQLQARMLDAGHGVRRWNSVEWSECAASLDIADELLRRMSDRGYANDTIEECLASDVLLGLVPDVGEFGGR